LFHEIRLTALSHIKQRAATSKKNVEFTKDYATRVVLLILLRKGIKFQYKWISEPCICDLNM